MKGFANLTESTHNRTHLERRHQLKNEDFSSVEVHDFSNLKDENGEFIEELRLAESYALSGIVIERMWTQLRELGEVKTQLENFDKIPFDEHFWQNFADRYIELETPLKSGLLDECRSILERPSEERSPEDNLLLRFFALQIQKEDQKKFGVPSFIDFVSIYTRLARVVDVLARDTYGDTFSKELFSNIISHNSFRQIMEQMMMNNRQALLPLFGLLEGNESPDSDDTSRSFRTGFFIIQKTEPSEVAIVPKPEFTQKIRDAYRIQMVKWKQENRVQPVLRCPVIYLGIMKDMCTWLHDNLMLHYPENTEVK